MGFLDRPKPEYKVYGSRSTTCEVSAYGDSYDPITLGQLRAIVAEADKLEMPDDANITVEGLGRSSRVDEQTFNMMYIRSEVESG